MGGECSARTAVPGNNRERSAGRRAGPTEPTVLGSVNQTLWCYSVLHKINIAARLSGGRAALRYKIQDSVRRDHLRVGQVKKLN